MASAFLFLHQDNDDRRLFDSEYHQIQSFYFHSTIWPNSNIIPVVKSVLHLFRHWLSSPSPTEQLPFASDYSRQTSYDCLFFPGYAYIQTYAHPLKAPFRQNMDIVRFRSLSIYPFDPSSGFYAGHHYLIYSAQNDWEHTLYMLQDKPPLLH